MKSNRTVNGRFGDDPASVHRIEGVHHTAARAVRERGAITKIKVAKPWVADL